MYRLASGALDSLNSLNRDFQGPPSGDDASGSPPPPLASRPACCTAQRSNSSATSSFPFALAQSNACKEPDFSMIHAMIYQDRLGMKILLSGQGKLRENMRFRTVRCRSFRRRQSTPPFSKSHCTASSEPSRAANISGVHPSAVIFSADASIRPSASCRNKSQQQAANFFQVFI